MEVSRKLGHLLRNVRLSLIEKYGSAEQLLAPWDSASPAASIDAECAERLIAIGYHNAMTDAVRACEFEQARHESASEFYSAARDFVQAGSHQLQAEQSKRCARAIKEILKCKGEL